MNNERRDELILETHSMVKVMDERTKKQEKQIDELFLGFNQTQRNTTAIKWISAIGSVMWATVSSVVTYMFIRNR